ncbi:MAG: 1-deoxy-D-xylulose-5-phosphate synthase N-terminal domain-containing protein [Enterobacterales bacterium]
MNTVIKLIEYFFSRLETIELTVALYYTYKTSLSNLIYDTNHKILSK